MFLKLLGSIILFIIAVVEKYWSKEISKNRYVKRGFFVLLVISLLFSIFTIVTDDIQTNENLRIQKSMQNDLVRKNDSLRLQLDSLLSIVHRSERQADTRSVVLQSKISELNEKLEPFVKLAVKGYPNMKIEDALEKLQKEIEGMKPRTFTSIQKAQFLNLLKNSPKGNVKIHCILGNEETESFGGEIKQLLDDLGWSTEISSPMFHKNPVGLIIGVHSRKDEPAYGAYLQNALDIIGFGCKGELNERYPNNVITLTVGLKPK